MRIHHLNCMTFHLGFKNVTHCLLLEAADGLVLVDTGLGLGDYAHPTPLVRAFTTAIRVPCDPEETAIRQIERLGLVPEDVRDIVLTHLHIDHAGGLPDFPWARVHVYAAEHEAATHPRRSSFKERFYVTAHWTHGPQWVLHSCAGERWFGCDCVRLIEKPVEVLLVPLLGHSRGHCGVAVGQGGSGCSIAGMPMFASARSPRAQTQTRFQARQEAYNTGCFPRNRWSSCASSGKSMATKYGCSALTIGSRFPL